MTRPKIYHRTCHRCGTDKLVAAFPKYSSHCFACLRGRAYGKVIVCTRCGREMKASHKTGLCRTCYIHSLPEKIGECLRCHETKSLKARQLCSRCYSSYRYHRNPQQWLARQRERRQENVARIKEADRKRYQRRKASGYEQKRYREYYLRNGERLREYQRQFRKTHPDLVLLYSERRRTRERDQFSDLTLDQWKQILKEHHYCCHYCGKHERKLQQEHKIPISRGGAHTYSNIVPACARCNRRKNTMTDAEFKAYLTRFPN